MADDTTAQLLTAIGGTVAGGGASAVAVRALFLNFREQLTALAGRVEQSLAKADERYERGVHDLAVLKAQHVESARQMNDLARDFNRALGDSTSKADYRYEKHVGELATLKGAIDAAHRRIDELTDRKRE